MKKLDANVAKALVAALWMYGGRGFGLLWTLAVIATLGIGDYGTYAMGFAAAAIVAAPLDHPFNVRAIRESADRYASERSARVAVGLTLMVAGAIAVPFAYVVWFALFVAGGEIVFNAYKSQALRDGDPQIVMRLDTLRQIVSIGAAGAYLFLASSPTLFVASLVYVSPYLIIAVVSVVRTKAARPAAPGNIREISLLFTENLANAVYIQGDILLLGHLTNSSIAGYFSVASVLGWAVASLGMSFGTTFHEKLRAAAGAVGAGPTTKQTVLVSLSAGFVVLIVGVVLLFSPAPTELAITMAIMSVFVVMRSMNYVYTTVLYIQNRDRTRVGASLVLAPLKMILVLALYRQGAVGAALASVATDLVLLLFYTRALYGRGSEKDQRGRSRDDSSHIPSVQGPGNGARG